MTNYRKHPGYISHPDLTWYCLLFLFLLAPAAVTSGQSVTFEKHETGKKKNFTLANELVSWTIGTDSGKIVADTLSAQPAWTKQFGSRASSIVSNGDFSFEVMWTDWQAPGKISNAENPVVITKSDLLLDAIEEKDRETGGKEVTLALHGADVPVLVKIVYALDANAFYVRRKIAISDTSEAGHFLQWVAPFNADVYAKPLLTNKGGFGQPVAFTIAKSGGFFGLEYPTSENTLTSSPKGSRIRCAQEMGLKIESSWIWSEWGVEGLTPDQNVKLWFMKYVNDIRVAPLKPYTLYNSWYDLRSAEYPKVPEGNVMNEVNIFRIIDLLKKNMIEKHQIQLDAFVLDDGWDVYESDWVLRDKQFPHGLKPISDELKKTNTGLGLWFGPTGGYSYRMKRIDWMKAHGYEVVGHTRNTAMLCVAGTKYGELFRKRTTDLVANEGVSFFKWDGIQFSCSEPDHGHPVGIYSRRAVMESMIDKVNGVREKNPKTYLNITSGTWLSPWWVKYANQIWMQGADYGYADVPSISPRDAAITYRDFVLYDDFKNQNMWFPIANLMTHGIIKGNLEMLGGREEPLDKFTNEALLYFSRGVSMWELYISPDILTDGEWDAMSEAMHWARDRFPVLSQTEMIGGDPTRGQTYGYIHFKESKGILAARNPSIEPKTLTMVLSPSLGLDPAAVSLVLEKTYPTRWISPRLYKAGEKVDLPLDGYETAIYEIYPLNEATGPLLAGVPFELSHNDDGSDVVSVYAMNPGAKILNPDRIKSMSFGSAPATLKTLTASPISQSAPVTFPVGKFKTEKNTITCECTLDESVREGTLALLLTPSRESARRKLPQVHVNIDGVSDTAKYEKGESASIWYTARLGKGKHALVIRVDSRDEDLSWKGTAAVWILSQQLQKGLEVTITPASSFSHPPMPPRPFPHGVRVSNLKLGESRLDGK